MTDDLVSGVWTSFISSSFVCSENVTDQPGNVMVNILFTQVMKCDGIGILHLSDSIKISITYAERLQPQ